VKEKQKHHVLTRAVFLLLYCFHKKERKKKMELDTWGQSQSTKLEGYGMLSYAVWDFDYEEILSCIRRIKRKTGFAGFEGDTLLYKNDQEPLIQTVVRLARCPPVVGGDPRLFNQQNAIKIARLLLDEGVCTDINEKYTWQMHRSFNMDGIVPNSYIALTDHGTTAMYLAMMCGLKEVTLFCMGATHGFTQRNETVVRFELCCFLMVLFCTRN